nr:hypothetical protein [Tanacetum cinerariifolium]
EDDKVVGASTTAASLEGEQESGNGPRRHVTTLGDTNAQTRFETASKQSHGPPLLEVNTSVSGEDSMEHQDDLTDCLPPTPHDSALLGGHTLRSDEDLVIKRLREKVKRLEKKQRELNLSNKGSGETKVFDYTTVAEKDVNGVEPVSTAGDAVNPASVIPDVSTVGPSISTAGDIFKDKMTTISDTLMAIRSTRPRTTSVVIHNVEEETRRATPQPTVQSQNKGKYINNQLKSKSYEEIQMLYEREQKWINDFVLMNSKVVNDSKQQAKSSKKRSRANHDKESVKKQKLEEDDIANGSSKNYKILTEMYDDFDRQDIIDLYRMVKERYETTSPKGYDLLLWRDLVTLFEPSEEDVIWKAQQDYNLII